MKFTARTYVYIHCHPKCANIVHVLTPQSAMTEKCSECPVKSVGGKIKLLKNNVLRLKVVYMLLTHLSSLLEVTVNTNIPYYYTVHKLTNCNVVSLYIG
jgi:hypothetical protein